MNLGIGIGKENNLIQANKISTIKIRLQQKGWIIGLTCMLFMVTF